MELRARVLAAYGHRCANCGATGGTLEVHHRDRDAFNNAMSNLVALCRPCHRRIGLEH
jgi:5-methylcytosine-specific restriction endonuclease McrA